MPNMENVPVDEQGKPMAKVSWQISETISLGNYSNVKVGPGEVTRYVKDTEKDRNEGLIQCVRDVESVLGEERQKIIDFRDSRKSSS